MNQAALGVGYQRGSAYPPTQVLVWLPPQHHTQLNSCPPSIINHQNYYCQIDFHPSSELVHAVLSSMTYLYLILLVFPAAVF